MKIDKIRREVRSQRERGNHLSNSYVHRGAQKRKKRVSENNALHGCYLDPTKVSPELVRTKQEDWLHLPSEEAHVMLESKHVQEPIRIRGT